MKTRNDFMKMSSLDIFLHNGSYKMVDENLQRQLDNLIKVMERHCMKKPNPKKFYEAHDEYCKVQEQKIQNKNEWRTLIGVAKTRRINLHTQVVVL